MFLCLKSSYLSSNKVKNCKKKLYLCKGDQATYFKNACIPCGSQSLAEVRALSIVYEFAKQTGYPGR